MRREHVLHELDDDVAARGSQLGFADDLLRPDISAGGVQFSIPGARPEIDVPARGSAIDRAVDVAELDVSAARARLHPARKISHGDIAARSPKVGVIAARHRHDKTDLHRRVAEPAAHASVIFCDGGDVAALLLDRQLEILEHLVRLGLAVGADLFLRNDLHRVAGARLHADVAARRFDLERAARLNREGLLNRPFNLGIEDKRGGKKPPDSDDQREMEFHDWKAGLR